MSIDISGALSAVASQAKGIQKMAGSDLSDPANALKLQTLLAKYQETFGTLSAIVADMKSTCMSIIQKM